jgi:spermidine synthase
LIYQVVWVRVFGNVFGNTIYSASLVVAVFMLGLGVGSYLVGVWSDRRYAELSLSLSHGEANRKTRLYRQTKRPEFSLLAAYGYFELLIAGLGLGISVLLPHLDRISVLVSSYSHEPNGWYALSTTAYFARGAIVLVFLTPITMLMGGTLTLLVRHLVRNDLEIGTWRIAVLYAVNTAGAALGCFLTDFALVPAWGLQNTQLIAVAFNAVAGAGALWLTRFPAGVRLQASPSRRETAIKAQNLQPEAYGQPAVTMTSLALAMSGFAAMGMEIVWFRHFSILLGEFRAVFSLLLTIILVGIGTGSLAGGFLHRRTARPADWYMAVQGIFVVTVLCGLAIADGHTIDTALAADPEYQVAAGRAAAEGLSTQSFVARTLTELWFNARPMLLELALPAFLMGFSFPLANAIIQRAERSVGRRAGVLYLSNTAGAVCGSLVAGFVLLPIFGIQRSATVLMMAAGLAILPLYLASRPISPTTGEASLGTRLYRRRDGRVAVPWGYGSHVLSMVGALLVSGVALGVWLRLPSDYVITRALPRPTENERLLALSDGLSEVIAVTEVPGQGRTLVTNGHPMSSTKRLSQRYMRALAHIPLLSIDSPQSVLVIGFGVGNTTHAATLHPSIRRVEVADLSRGILTHAKYFDAFNRNVLSDPKVSVYVNDGRHHVQMQPANVYDVIVLEPPPIAYAGVASLYSRDFYELARTRLKPKGYLSQWLPAYQVPSATALAMVRAFVDVFPQAVLLSGAESDLLLLGVNDSHIEIDPARIAAALSRAPAVHADLQRLDLGSVREIVGAFVGSAQTLAEATRAVPPVTDDRPIQEYDVRSLLNVGGSVPASVVDLSQVAAWCPRCFVNGKPVPLVEGLDRYLALLDFAYKASPAEVTRAASLAEHQARTISGSAYLGAIVPETADVHNFLGIALAEKGQLDEAIAEFSNALRLEPDSARTHWHLGAALASRGAHDDAVEHLRRSVQIDPGNGQAHYDLAVVLLETRRLDEAVDHFQATLRLTPNSVEAHNNLGLVLAQQGKLDEAVDHFQQALTLDPASADAQRNLTIVLQQRRQLLNRNGRAR